MDAATRLRKDHQALVGEALGLSTWWARTWKDDMHWMGMEVEIARMHVDTSQQQPLQDLDPHSSHFGEPRFTWGADGFGSRPL